MDKEYLASKFVRTNKLVEDIDELIAEGVILPINLVLDIMENHLLEDGVKGDSEYQDLLSDAWNSLREARKLKVEE